MNVLSCCLKFSRYIDEIKRFQSTIEKKKKVIDNYQDIFPVSFN